MDKSGKIAFIGAVALALMLTAVLVTAPPPAKECRDGLDNDGDGNTDWPADAGCNNKNDNDETNCGDGVCEGGETVASCAVDCQVCGNNVAEGTETCDGTDLAGETCGTQGFDGGTLVCAGTCDAFVTSSCYDNTCSDTDGGNDPLVFGTTSGDYQGSPYSDDDVCQDASNVLEYYCSGDLEQSQAHNCGTDSSVDFCNDGDVWTNATDFFCGSGKCDFTGSVTLTEACDHGCENGECYVCSNNQIEGTEVCDGTDLGNETCQSQGFDGGTLGCLSSCDGYDTSGCWNDSCSDTDGGFNINVAGTVSGFASGWPFSFSDFCANSITLVEHYCVGSYSTLSNFTCTGNFTGCSSGRCV